MHTLVYNIYIYDMYTYIYIYIHTLHSYKQEDVKKSNELCGKITALMEGIKADFEAKPCRWKVDSSKEATEKQVCLIPASIFKLALIVYHVYTLVYCMVCVVLYSMHVIGVI